MSDSEPDMAPIRVPPKRAPEPPAAKAAPPPAEDDIEMAPIAIPPRTISPPGASTTGGEKSRQKRTTLPADLIPGYVLDQWLGEGTMGAVYRAKQLSLDRTVAIKVLTPQLAKSENYLMRFQREARAVAKLNHPNVVSGIDVGESRGCRFFVMEYVEGPTLLEFLEKTGRLDPTAAAKIILQIAKALDHAHRANLVHRDVKPANIIVMANGTAKLCDLGLAKEVTEGGADTNEGRAMGTPFYISPEQARGEAAVDIRSDIYSLGATFYHAVCGRPPFQGPTPAVIMAKHLTEPVTPVKQVVPSVPLGICAVIERALRKKREERYQTPAQMIAELESVLDGRWKPSAAIASRRNRLRRR